MGRGLESEEFSEAEKVHGCCCRGDKYSEFSGHSEGARKMAKKSLGCDFVVWGFGKGLNRS